MEAQIRTLVDISDTEAAHQGLADMVLDRARWAASIFMDRNAFPSVPADLIATSVPRTRANIAPPLRRCQHSPAGLDQIVISPCDHAVRIDDMALAHGYFEQSCSP